MEAEVDKGRLAQALTCAAKLVHANSVAKGFWSASENVAEKLALVHSEVSECLEAWRAQEPDMDAVAEELADAVIRVFDLAEFLGVDIGAHIMMKHERNTARPYLHGKRF